MLVQSLNLIFRGIVCCDVKHKQICFKVDVVYVSYISRFSKEFIFSLTTVCHPGVQTKQLTTKRSW